MSYLMVDSLFNAGHETIVIDATNCSAKRRDEWRKHCDNMELRVFDTSPDECKRRAIDTGQGDLVFVIDRMVKEWDLPIPDSWKFYQKD
jgi:predicted kinase